MNWIFPLAGKGSRVKSLGKFKPFISVNNKKIIEWFLLGIKKKIKNKHKIFFITTVEFNNKFKFTDKVKNILKKNKVNCKYHVRLIKETPYGPAFTVETIINLIKNNQPCIVGNADQFIDFEMPKKLNKNEIYMPLHYNNHGNSSYVSINQKKISSIQEKKLISNYASSGIYIFGSFQIFKSLFKNLKKIKMKNEVNISDLIDYYLKKNNKKANGLMTFFKYDLGNAKSIKDFIFKNIKI